MPATGGAEAERAMGKVFAAGAAALSVAKRAIEKSRP